MNIRTISAIGLFLIAVGVVSAIVGIYVIFIGVNTPYSGCRLGWNAGCQIVADSPYFGIVSAVVGAILYGSARVSKGRASLPASQ